MKNCIYRSMFRMTTPWKQSCLRGPLDLYQCFEALLLTISSVLLTPRERKALEDDASILNGVANLDCFFYLTRYDVIRFTYSICFSIWLIEDSRIQFSRNSYNKLLQSGRPSVPGGALGLQARVLRDGRVEDDHCQLPGRIHAGHGDRAWRCRC